MTAGSVTVWIVPGDVQTGIWCDICLLPSIIRFPLYQLSDFRGPAASLLGTVEHCHGHDDKPRIRR
jgi:hypothetical protein